MKSELNIQKLNLSNDDEDLKDLDVTLVNLINEVNTYKKQRNINNIKEVEIKDSENISDNLEDENEIGSEDKMFEEIIEKRRLYGVGENDKGKKLQFKSNLLFS